MTIHDDAARIAAAAWANTPTDGQTVAGWDALWQATAGDLAEELGNMHRENAELHERLKNATAREVRHIALIRRHEHEIARLRARLVPWYVAAGAGVLAGWDDLRREWRRHALGLALVALSVALLLAAVFGGPGGV